MRLRPAIKQSVLWDALLPAPAGQGISCRQLALIIVPVLVGGTAYLLFRPSNLLMFKWVESLGGAEILVWARMHAKSLNASLPYWAIYSLPHGLWAFSLAASLLVLWRRQPVRPMLLWLGVAGGLAIGSEILQLFGLLQGVFDYSDLVVAVSAFILALGFESIKGTT